MVLYEKALFREGLGLSWDSSARQGLFISEFIRILGVTHQKSDHTKKYVEFSLKKCPV